MSLEILQSTIEIKEASHKHRKSHAALAVFFLAAELAGCGMKGENTHASRGSTASAEYERPERLSAQMIQDRYAAAGRAEDVYENCLRRYTPDYDEQMRRYGEIYLGAEGAWISPAVEGCKTERETMRRTLDIAQGG